jgi:hypothetical protein
MNTSSIHPLSPQDITDFLHRFSTESVKALVLLVNPSAAGMNFTVPGKLEISGDTLVVKPTPTPDRSGILEHCGFAASLPALLRTPCFFTDPRMFSGPEALKREVPFSFGLTFVFPNGSILAFMEIAEVSE